MEVFAVIRQLASQYLENLHFTNAKMRFKEFSLRAAIQSSQSVIKGAIQ